MAHPPNERMPAPQDRHPINPDANRSVLQGSSEGSGPTGVSCLGCPECREAWWRIADERDALAVIRCQLDGLDALCTPLEHRVAALTWALAVIDGTAV
jgi:hypothetical protein